MDGIHNRLICVLSSYGYRPVALAGLLLLVNVTWAIAAHLSQLTLVTLCLGILISALCRRLLDDVSQALSPIDLKRSLASSIPWKLPPGPKRTSILGYLPSFMRGTINGSQDMLIKLAVQYGEMTTLHLGSKTWILLNSGRVCHEIIVKRGYITSERAYLPVASGLVSRGMRTLVQQQDKWTENRRAMHQLFTGSALSKHALLQQEECTRLMQRYLSDPHHWAMHNHMYSARVLHRIVLGTDFTKTPADLLELDKTVTEFTESMFGTWVDWFPVLDQLPRCMQFWRRRWERVGAFHNHVYHKWYDTTRDAIAAGTSSPCWTKDVLLNPNFRYKGSEDDAMYCAIQMIEGGTATTKATLNTFIMAMALEPQALARLRAEIDYVCDTDAALRSPTVDDLDSLPYAAAVVKEVLRWRPMFLSPEHTLSKDLDFQGYHIPAGVSFVINGCAVANECHDPTSFIPERWLDGNEHNILSGLWQFGGGRRVCPAHKFAQRGLMLCFARLAQSFDIVLNIHSLDQYKLNTAANDDGKFPVTIKVRSVQHHDLIMADVAAVGLS